VLPGFFVGAFLASAALCGAGGAASTARGADVPTMQAEATLAADESGAPVVTFHLPAGFTGSARVMIPLGDVPLGELSPSTGLAWKAGNLTVMITSGGIFPNYRVWARSLTALDGTPGRFNTRDVGLGIFNVVARNPLINPTYDYDPSSVAKDVDGEPVFRGTIASLGLVAPPGTLLYRTRGVMFARSNQFTLRFASAPQFYSVGSSAMQIEITLSVP